jgi:hypothetical protein
MRSPQREAAARPLLDSSEHAISDTVDDRGIVLFAICQECQTSSNDALGLGLSVPVDELMQYTLRPYKWLPFVGYGGVRRSLRSYHLTCRAWYFTCILDTCAGTRRRRA